MHAAGRKWVASKATQQDKAGTRFHISGFTNIFILGALAAAAECNLNTQRHSSTSPTAPKPASATHTVHQPTPSALKSTATPLLSPPLLTQTARTTQRDDSVLWCGHEKGGSDGRALPYVLLSPRGGAEARALVDALRCRHLLVGGLLVDQEDVAVAEGVWVWVWGLGLGSGGLGVACSHL